jgi:hypothetical protein
VGEKIRFTSSILPKWARRTKSLDALLPLLYLRWPGTGCVNSLPPITNLLAANPPPDIPRPKRSGLGTQRQLSSAADMPRCTRWSVVGHNRSLRALSDARVIGVTFNHELPAGPAVVPPINGRRRANILKLNLALGRPTRSPIVTIVGEAIMNSSLRQAATPQHRSRPRGNDRPHPKTPSSGQHPRRRFLGLVAGAAALPAISRIASALDYPTRPVRVIVPFAAGGPSDVFARLIAQRLTEQLRKQFYVEDIAGGNTNVGTSQAAKALPDGHTMLVHRFLGTDHLRWIHVIHDDLYPSL